MLENTEGSIKNGQYINLQESVYRRGTDTTMTKRTSPKGQTTINKTHI
jgi:hypothetical protein